jgi:hypothetical protein
MSLVASRRWYFWFFAATFSVALTWNSPGGANTWQPELLSPPAENYWLPTDRIEIRLPAETTNDRISRLALELNNYDVSDLVTLEGETVVLTPPQPFATGDNELRLIEYKDDGDFVVRGVWTFNVRETAAIQDLAAEVQIGTEVLYRFADRNLANPLDRLTSRGGANVSAIAGEKNWRSSVSANFIYNSELDRTIDGRNFDIGEYLFNGELDGGTLKYGIRSGHQDIGADNLLISDFYRRGGSVSVGTTDDRATITAFALQSEPTVGSTHITGIGDQDNRADGIHAILRPSFAAADNFEISTTYYTGVDSLQGEGITGEETKNSGSGWNVAFDSLWLENRLFVHGELAFSKFDFDGDGIGFGSESDSAYYLSSRYMPIQGYAVGESYIDLTLGVEHDSIGTFYRAITNPSVVEDRERTSLFGDLGWGSFSLRSQIAHETDNVDNNDLVPRNRAYDYSLDANYSPIVEFGEDGSAPWYGQPNFGLTLTHYDIKQTKTPQGFQGNPLNNYTSGATLSAGSSFDAWRWALSYSISKFEDETNLTSDTITHFTDLNGQVSVNEWLQLTPSLQWGNYRDLDLDTETNNVNLGLGTEIEWISGILSSRINYNLNLQTGSNDTPDRQTILGDLVWVVVAPEDERPGLEFLVSGQLDTQSDDVDDGLPDTAYQVFTGLRVTFATGK